MKNDTCAGDNRRTSQLGNLGFKGILHNSQAVGHRITNSGLSSDLSSCQNQGLELA